MGRREHAGCVVHAGGARPAEEIDPIFAEFGFEYATAGKIGDQGELSR